MTGPRDGTGDYELHRPTMRSDVIADALIDPEVRARFGWPVGEEALLPVVLELNVRHRAGLSAAADALTALWEADWPQAVRVAEIYVRAELSLAQVRTLVQADMRAHPESADRAIYRAWPDFPVRPLIDASVVTVKADAARRSYDAAGRDVVWAVVDSGIEQRHPHFQAHGNLTGEVAELQPGLHGRRAAGIRRRTHRRLRSWHARRRHHRRWARRPDGPGRPTTAGPARRRVRPESHR